MCCTYMPLHDLPTTKDALIAKHIRECMEKEPFSGGRKSEVGSGRRHILLIETIAEQEGGRDHIVQVKVQKQDIQDSKSAI